MSHRIFESEKPLVLSAELFVPEDAPKPMPAVVLMHGCAGIEGNHRAWAQEIRDMGYVALLLDSFSARGVRTKCGAANQGAGSYSDRVRDAYGALTFLRQQPIVDGERIVVIGWSHGGGTVLRVMDVSYRPTDFKSGFAGAIAFYPYCQSERKSFYADLLILIGEKDDWTPATQCQSMANLVTERSAPVDLITYSDAVHAFDYNRPPVSNMGHVLAYNAAATEDSRIRVRQFLEAHFK